MREVRQAATTTNTTTVIDPLAQSGDGWEQLLVELRRQAMADTLSTLDAIWRDDDARAA